MMRAAAGLVGLLFLALPAFAKTPEHTLPAIEAERWIAAAKAQRGADGRTLLEVLQTAQRLRPNEFKFGKFAIGYDPTTGEPDCVTVETWIGSNREADETTNVMLPIKRGTDKVTVAIPYSAGIFLDGLRDGGDTLLSAIDEQYRAVCVDYKSGAKSC